MNHLLKSVVCLSFVAGLALMGVEPAEPSLYISFDEGIRADFGGLENSVAPAPNNKPTGMYGELLIPKGQAKRQPKFGKGLAGNGVLVGKDEATGLIDTVIYYPKPGIPADKGTVTLWIHPETWQGNDGQYHTFVTLNQGNSRILIYKIPYQNRMVVFHGDLNKKETQSQAFYPTPNWKSGEWHFLAASWEAKKVTLYIDGKKVSEVPVKAPLTGMFQSMKVGECWSGKPGITLVDDLRFFKNVLTAEEVLAEYHRYAN